MMLTQLLRQAGYGATYLAIGAVNNMLDQVKKGGFKIAYVSALPPFAVGQARSLCKRLRASFPDLVIVVGLWEFAGGVPKAQERVGVSTANAVVTTLAEALLQIRILPKLGADIEEKPEMVENNSDNIDRREADFPRSAAAIGNRK
jgi:hypothetical protein